jgi:hypothetical protein
VTSSIQTQLNGKQNALTNPVTGTGSSGQVAYWSSSSAITGESNLFWDATNDRLGIGTNTPATTLEVNGVGLFSGTSLVGNTKNGVYIYDQSILSLAGNGARPLNIQGQTLSIYTGNTYSEKLKVFENGNVVISTSPVDAGFKLDVNGTGRFSGAATFNSDLTANVGTITFTSAANIYMPNIIRNGTTGNAFFQYNGTDTRFVSLNGAGSIVFRNNANTTNLLNITDAGNVGIGTATPNLTAANRAVLDINGTNNSLLVFSSGGTYKSYIYNDGVGLTLQAATLQFETSFIPRIHITSLGNVGIGTTSPTTRLHVEVPTGTDQVARFSRGPSNAGDIMFGLGDYGGGYQSRIGALQLAFEVNRANGAGLDTGTTAMFIKSSGNVLIGTTTDNGLGRLQVNGTITVAGGVRFSSSGADANRWSVYWNGGTGDLIVVNNISDIRAKKDFDYNIKGLETIQKLKPLKFTWKDGTSHSTSVSGRLRQYGFIAQETMEADDYLAWHNQSQDTWGIEQYESFSAVIVKAIQELSAKIETLETEIQILKNLEDNFFHIQLT